MINQPKIAILGASGLIGHAIATALPEAGYPVLPVARRFTPAQRAAFRDGIVEGPIAAPGILADLVARHRPAIVVNCLGVLQDGPRGQTGAIHRDLVAELLAALAALPEPALLVHISIPGVPEKDKTDFSRTKRQAERLIAESAKPFVILRPGFVIAPAAYGGSALIRALAMAPLALPHAAAARPFAATDVRDLTRTVALVAERWRAGERNWRVTWDVLERQPSSVGGVVEAFRAWLGGPAPLLPLPAWLLRTGARLGNGAARLGWAPPIRSTALAEMLRGVTGDPAPWMAATGIAPASLTEILTALPATVQERWFARLYLAKGIIIPALSLFWVASGLIALFPAFAAARAILTSHGFPFGLAHAITIVSSLVDIAVGLAIAARPTCRRGLWAGIAVSLGYMAGAVVLTPDLWLEPLGALVKTFPAIVLMGVALAILDER